MIEKKSNFQDARINLRNLNRSPSPIQQEIINDFEEIPKIEKIEKLGKEINDHEMIRYNLKDIEP